MRFQSSTSISRNSYSATAADDALVIEFAVGKQAVGLEEIVLDAGEHVLDRVDLIFIVTDVCHRQLFRLSVGDDGGRPVAVACGRPIFGSYRTESAFLSVVLAVIGVIDKVDGDDFRLFSVKDRRSEPSKQEIRDEFKPVSVECM